MWSDGLRNKLDWYLLKQDPSSNPEARSPPSSLSLGISVNWEETSSEPTNCSKEMKILCLFDIIENQYRKILLGAPCFIGRD